MSNRNDIEASPGLSDVMLKMKKTLTALGNAFDQAMSIRDPIDQSQHEIDDVMINTSTKQEVIEG